MFLTIRGVPSWISRSGLTASAKRSARRYVLLSRLNSAEQVIDQYLKKEIGEPLQWVCLRLIDGCSVQKAGDEYTIRFPNKEQEKLAMIITHGNGKFHGSKILLRAFK